MYRWVDVASLQYVLMFRLYSYTSLRRVKFECFITKNFVTCIVSNITNCMTSDILTIILVVRGIVKQLHFKLEQTYIS